MSGIQNLWGREPAMVVAFVGAVLTLGMAFGLSLTLEQTGAILAVVQIALGLVTRSQVSPTTPAVKVTSYPPQTPLPTGSEPMP